MTAHRADIVPGFMGPVYHSYSFISASFCKRFGLLGPIYQNCRSFHFAKDLLQWYGVDLSSLPVGLAWTWQRQRNSCKHTKASLLMWPTWKARDLSTWHRLAMLPHLWPRLSQVGHTCGKHFEEEPLSRVTLPSVKPSMPAVAKLLSGFHPH